MSKLLSVRELHMKMAEVESAKATAALKAHEAEFPALLPPQEVVQIGGYTPVPVDDDGTYARRVGFEAS